MSTAERAPYAVVGAAQRAAITKATKTTPKLRMRDMWVLNAIFAMVTSYSRLSDRVTQEQLAGAAGIGGSPATQRTEVKRALARLRDAGIIEYEAARGRGRASVVGLPPACGDVAAGSAPTKKGGSSTRHFD